MAKIAEMAEKKSEKKAINPVLMEITGSGRKDLSMTTAKKVGFRSLHFP